METKYNFNIGEWIGIDAGFIITNDNLKNDRYESFKTKKLLLWSIQISYGCNHPRPRTKRLEQGVYSYIVRGEEEWEPEVLLVRLTSRNISQYRTNFEEQSLDVDNDDSFS